MRRERDTDAVGYVLGELDAEAAAAFERAMDQNSTLRDEVERIRPIALGLERLPGEAWNPPVAPPLAVLSEPPPRARRPQWRLAAAACAVGLVLVGVVIGVLLGDDGEVREPAGPERQIALEPVGDAGRGARGRVDLRGGDSPLTLRVDGLEPAGADQFYELWLLGREGELIALGSFTVGPDGTAIESLPLPVDPSQFQYFDLSVEAADGDPAHSGESLLRGPTTS